MSFEYLARERHGKLTESCRGGDVGENPVGRPAKRQRQEEPLVIDLVSDDDESDVIFMGQTSRDEIPTTAATVPAPTVAANKGVGFLDLPRTVRNSNYRLVLRSDRPVPVSSDWCEVPDRTRTGLEPAILRACRKTASEGMRVLYGENTFSYHLRKGPVGADEELRDITNTRHLYLAKHAHLLRKFEIVAGPTCTKTEHRDRLAAAVRKIPAKARLDVLTLRLSPMRVIKTPLAVVLDRSAAQPAREHGALTDCIEVEDSTTEVSMASFFDPDLPRGPVRALLQAPTQELELVVHRKHRHVSRIDTRFLAANVAKMVLAPDTDKTAEGRARGEDSRQPHRAVASRRAGQAEGYRRGDLPLARLRAQTESRVRAQVSAKGHHPHDQVRWRASRRSSRTTRGTTTTRTTPRRGIST